MKTFESTTAFIKATQIRIIGQNNWLPNTLLHCGFQFSMLSYLRFWLFDVKNYISLITVS